MSIEQLKLILYDMCQMDLWYPPLFGKWSDEFKKSSYSQWAVDELVDYIAEIIYPRSSASIDEFCQFTYGFMIDTAKYARVNPRNCLMFQTASDIAADILDLLRAMR